ncbi:MAG: hypothetical protein ACRAVC_25400 [Trichormus sp.]
MDRFPDSLTALIGVLSHAQCPMPNAQKHKSFSRTKKFNPFDKNSLKQQLLYTFRLFAEIREQF